MNGVDLQMPAQKRIPAYQALSLVLALLFCTYLRLSIILLYPLLIVFFFLVFRWNLDRNAKYLIPFIFFCWLLSFRHGFDLKYNLVNFYFFIPFFFLLLAVPSQKADRKYNVRMLMTALALIVAVNNVVGIVQYALHPYDDSFSGIYGIFTVSQNGLSLVNTVLFFYFLSMFQEHRKFIYLLLSAFFITCMVLGFYGAGVIALIATLVLVYLRIKLVNIIKLALISIILIAIVGFLMKTISPATYDYNVAIIKIFLNRNPYNFPRKLLIFKNYISSYPLNIPDFLFGSGPGTFNSRSAFMVGSPTYFNVDFIKSEYQPYYFRTYAYSLWNPSNVGPYDGFMNQPFTSILALLGEYGLLLTAGIIYVAVRRFRHVIKLVGKNAFSQEIGPEFQLFRFSSIFAFVLILIDNYIEYPEIIVLLLLIAKLSQQQIVRKLSVS